MPNYPALLVGVWFSMQATHYDTLNITSDASQLRIRKAYLKCAFKVHPDRNKSSKATEEFQQLGAAYAVLSDPDQRAEYDLFLQDKNSANNQCCFTQLLKSIESFFSS